LEGVNEDNCSRCHLGAVGENGLVVFVELCNLVESAAVELRACADFYVISSLSKTISGALIVHGGIAFASVGAMLFGSPKMGCSSGPMRMPNGRLL